MDSTELTPARVRVKGPEPAPLFRGLVEPTGQPVPGVQQSRNVDFFDCSFQQTEDSAFYSILLTSQIMENKEKAKLR